MFTPTKKNRWKLLLILLLVTALPGIAQVTLPRLISDGMVLQRDTDIRIWGWASPKEQVERTNQSSSGV